MRKPPPSLLVNSGLALILLAGAGGSYLLLRGDAATAQDSGSAQVASTSTVSTGTVTRSVTADGTVTAASTATAEFETSGTVTEIEVEVGDTVEKGQTLATVDDTDAQRELDLAEENLDAAEESLDRAETDAEEETAEDSVDEAEEAVAEAEDSVDGTVLTAPASGTVIAVNGSVGGSSGGSSSSSSTGGSEDSGMTGTDSTDSSSSSSSEGFIQIADLDDLEVTASVAEEDAADVAVGQASEISWNAIDATSSGEVTTISPTAGSSGNVATYDVTLSIDEVPEQVRLGQTVSVTITVEEVADVLNVPTAAVEISGDTGTVTVVAEDGTQTETTVQIGLEGDSAVEVTSGLTEGETVALTVSDEESSGSGEMEIPDMSQMGGGGDFSGGGGDFSGGGGFPGGG